MTAPAPTSLKVRLLGLGFVGLLEALHRTWRIETVGLEGFDAALSRGERVMVGFWHGKYLPLFALLRGRRACIFASRSFRGEVICEICRHFGYQCIRIAEHAGDQTIALMREALQGQQAAATAVDGPLGPYHAVHRGAIQLAAELGMTLLPVSFAANRPHVLAKRWDRMEIPLPGTRLCLAFGEPLQVPRDLGGLSLQQWGKRLHEGLDETERRARLRLHRR